MRFLNKYMKKISAAALALVLLLPNSVNADEPKYRDSYSKSSIVSDFETGRIVYEKNANQKMSMASLTKLMTLLLTFDAMKENKVNESDVVTVIRSDVNREGTHMNLVSGDQVSLGELMKGMMVVSANDASLSIARHVGGNYSNFVSMMNKKAKEIGMTNTIFYNPNGLPQTIQSNGKYYNVENKTTAKDVLTLSNWLYEKYPDKLTKITSIRRYVNTKKGINEVNTNPLLAIYDNVDGLKTGFTNSAGYCLSYSMLVGQGDGNDTKYRLIGVSMGTQSKESRRLASSEALKFISNYYKSKTLFKKGSKVVSTNINGSSLARVDLVANRDIKVIRKTTEKIRETVEYKSINMSTDVDAPLAEYVIRDSLGNVISRTSLYPSTPISKMSYPKRVAISISSMINQFKNIKSRDLKYPIINIL